jgi:hypothetical protein
MGQSCYGSKLLRVKVATGSKLQRIKVATYKVATPIKWVKVSNHQRNDGKSANKSTAEAKSPPVRWLWFTVSSVGPLKAARSTGGQSSQRLWLFIQLLIGQEALAMLSEEDEADCLTNNSLERYTHGTP